LALRFMLPPEDRPVLYMPAMGHSKASKADLMMARAVGDSPLSREALRGVRRRVLNLTGAEKVPRAPGKAAQVEARKN